MPTPDNGRVAAEHLTLTEQASLASGATLWETKPVERVGLPSIRFSDGPHGLRRQGARDEYIGSGRSEPATCFPPAVALGSSWDPALLVRMGEALGREARQLDVQVLLGPGINIKRSPLCGRNFEYFSEDPHLSGVLGAALIEGVQSQGVGTSLKHFAVNNQETDRQRVSADVDERTLREIYLAAFEYAVTHAQPWTVMTSYNRINGTYSSESRWLVTGILREEWGFKGLVVSDWGGIDDRVAALRAGVDLEMPTMGGSTDALLVRAVEDGSQSPELLGASAGRVINLIERATSAPAVPAPDLAAHHRLAREIAGQCAVLLKNDGVLPFAAGASLAIIGELARSPRIQGAGSSQVAPPHIDCPLEEMRSTSGKEIPFAAGYRLDAGSPDLELEAAAVNLARSAEITVVFLGLPAPEESEGFDRSHIDLPAHQLGLLRAVAATGTRVVVVLSNGGLVKVSDWDDQAHAILEGWLLGQAGGGAIADILFGTVNPSGKLAETIPERLEDTPSYLNFPGEQAHVRYGEGVFVGYRYHDAIGGAVSYPFGHGLSYTTFDYEGLDLKVRGQGETLEVDVTVRLINAGARPGREVVQVYVSAPGRTVRRPPNELRAFRKIELAPGESALVHLVLGWRDFAYYDVARPGWSVESGSATIALGASSRDIRLDGPIPIVGTEVAAKITVDSTLAEWAAHPAGRNVLEREMQSPSGSGGSSPRFLSEASLKTVGSFPLSRLARFPGAHLDPARLEEFAEEVNASMIDRQRLVRRHNVVLSDWHPSSTLSVGNGDFACNVDVTGLQTFPAEHELLPRPTCDGSACPFDRDDFPVPLRIQSTWGWYNTETGERYGLDQASSDYQTARGPVRYADQLRLNADGSPPDGAGGWLYANPRRLDLGRLGLRLGGAGAPDGAVGLSDLTRTRVELDLYSGCIHSSFEVLGSAVEVWTVAHPDLDVVATRVHSDLLARGELSIALTFPPQGDPLGRLEQLRDGAVLGGSDGPPWLKRSVGDATYAVTLETDGQVSASESGLVVGTSGPSLALSVAFGTGPDPSGDVPAFEEVRSASASHWRDFWSSGAAVEFAGSTDPRAHELERRVVLSQYLTAVHCSGSLPPQESGLVHNSWGGKFHLEMHWWHAAHFALWGRPALLERSLGWYRSIMPKARLAAQRQGYLGVRWPKQVGPDGRESPSIIGSFIVWQQPHPIYFAELLWLNTGDPAVLDRYRDIVFATAEFMADFPDRAGGSVHLGPPLVPAQESYHPDRATTSDPTFELAYWYWGLHVAQQWRARLGLAPCAQWDEVMANLAPPRIERGTYAGVAQPPYEVRQDHPSMLMALGFVPQTPLIDPGVVDATLDEVLAEWDLGTTWGWDYPTLAMCATKLGRPATALDVLMLDTYKNHYLASGQVPQFPGGLSVYLPANGGLLAAVAMMIGGWQGAERTLPGFPDDGSWRVAHEGFGVFPTDVGRPGGPMAEAATGTRGRDWP